MAKIVVGGSFSTIGGVTRSGIARLNADGTVDTTFDSGLGEGVYALAIQQDGRILIGGGFTTIENQSRNYFARLLGSAVTWDPFQMWKIGCTINPGVADSSVQGPDGLPVLAEYALGGNPPLVNQAILPVVGMTTQSLTLNYNKVRSDVSYWVEVSTDLLNWTSSGVNQGGSGPSVTASVPMGGASRKFVRLRFTRP